MSTARRRLAAALVVMAVAVVPAVARGGSQTTSGPRALFVGDSLFVGVGASPKRPVQIRTAADLLGWSPTIDAVSGTGYTTGGRNGRPYLSRLRADGYLRHQYDVVVLEGGTNDAHHGTLSALHDAALQTVDYVRARQPHARIVLVGAFVAHGVRDQERYSTADAVLGDVARERGLLYVSQYKYSDDLDPGFLSHDRFHPSDAGYQLMGRDLAEAISR